MRRLGGGRRDPGGQLPPALGDDAARGLAVPQDAAARRRHHEHPKKILQILKELQRDPAKAHPPFLFYQHLSAIKPFQRKV